MKGGLAPRDRAKLVRVLGLLGSPFAGERDAAGLAAHRLVTARGLTWADVVGGTAPGRAGQVAVAPGREAFVADARACLQRPELFDEWERLFLENVTRWRHLSRKQAAILAHLVERLRAAQGEAG